MYQILVLEDDFALAQGIALALRATARVKICLSIAQASTALSKAAFDLILLDVNLPDGSGVDFCQTIRKTSQTPILFLTAQDSEFDEVAGLEAGADDYIMKPFRLAVLRARIDAALRRANLPMSPSPCNAFRFDSLCLDFESHVFLKDGHPISLSPTEQKLLHLFVSHAGCTLHRNSILDHVWGDCTFVDENTLSVWIRRLRKKLETDPNNPTYLQTVYGIGYVWKQASSQ